MPRDLIFKIYTEDFKNDYVSPTDIAKYKNKEEPSVVVANWMQNHNIIEYLGIWEKFNNTNFNLLEFEGYLKEAGSNAFTLSPQKWVNTTNAVGLFVKIGRGGGTFAHREISKINYRIHTDAIKTNLLKDLSDARLSFKYASEADVLTVALFDKTGVRTNSWTVYATQSLSHWI